MKDRCVVELHGHVLTEMAQAAKLEAVEKHGKAFVPDQEIVAQLLPKLREAIKGRCGNDRIADVTILSDVPGLTSFIDARSFGEIANLNEILYSCLAWQAVILLGIIEIYNSPIKPCPSPSMSPFSLTAGTSTTAGLDWLFPHSRKA